MQCMKSQRMRSNGRQEIVASVIVLATELKGRLSARERLSVSILSTFDGEPPFDRCVEARPRPLGGARVMPLLTNLILARA